MICELLVVSIDNLVADDLAYVRGGADRIKLGGIVYTLAQINKGKH